MVVYSTPVFTPVGPTLLPSNNRCLPLCSIATTPAFLAVPIIKRTCNVSVVWHLIFMKMFSCFLPHSWRLVAVSSKPSGRWHTFVDSAKVRFACELSISIYLLILKFMHLDAACGHGWTSMKGRIAFWCAFSNNTGVVAYRLYGQQCDNCQGESYEPAMWYPEEMEKVLWNICSRVAHVFYGCARPPIQLNRRPGKPKNPHNSEKCQACKDGVCAERR
ncbi:putative receptor-transporting protein [Nephila pilipes]|uniref:Putative receptor-transporting protein n=1 Tax=Nephila pilipes TaxID=299642 RepID=A0A8X6T832_NEPPI|nr:putative receptor-transporting protein [Nephila pilipes]